MKQSSIEWIYNNLKSHFEHDGDLLEAVKMSFEQAKAMYEDEMKKFGIKCQMAMYSSDHVWSVEDVWDKEFKKQQNETE
jgi:hypothetical protein